MSDFTVHDHGSLALVYVNTDGALLWAREHLSEQTQWFGQAFAVEPRYLATILDVIIEEGFDIQ